MGEPRVDDGDSLLTSARDLLTPEERASARRYRVARSLGRGGVERGCIAQPNGARTWLRRTVSRGAVLLCREDSEAPDRFSAAPSIACIRRDDGSILVVEFKTGRRRASHERQLELYVSAAQASCFRSVEPSSRTAGQRHSSIYTIGHSTHSAEEFVELLQVHGIRQLADIRLIPAVQAPPPVRKETLGAMPCRRPGSYTAISRTSGGCGDRARIPSIRRCRSRASRGYADHMRTEIPQGICWMLLVFSNVCTAA